MVRQKMSKGKIKLNRKVRCNGRQVTWCSAMGPSCFCCLWRGTM